MTDGVYAQPMKLGHNWVIPAEITIENTGKSEAGADVNITFIDKAGKVAVSVNSKVMVPALMQQEAKINLTVDGPELWDTGHPVLYKVITRINGPDNTRDSLVTACGFRTIRFDADSTLELAQRQYRKKHQSDGFKQCGKYQTNFKRKVDW